jgi:primosomal protein N' (replication factor Y)
MTFHRGLNRLVCHYCGRTRGVPAECPKCRSRNLDRTGVGTERVEAVVRERFPDARVARLDRDTAGARGPGPGAGGLERIIKGMHAGEIDVLVGTQMVTKGHDFPGVTLVGVLRPDQGIDLPDFRAAERTFQLLEQVAGRAGRGERPGRVIIQTYKPEHAAIASVRTHDYDGFVRGELADRREAGYPPFSRMAVLRIDAQDEAAARLAADAMAAAATLGPQVRVRRGPAPIGRIRGRSRYQVWISAQERAAVMAAARAGEAARPPGDVRVVIDVDPQSAL